VVKRGTLLSTFLVLTLLILLAPAMVLTGGSVALSNGEAVTEEVEATCTFTEEVPGGQWWGFTAGSGGIQPPGPDLEQFTRDRVIAPLGAGVEVPGCAFRNYTATASPGVVTSTTGDLNGTMTLEWITVAFPGAYPGDTKYATADHYGWVYGRGHYYDEGSPASNFTFGFVLDWDGDANMTPNAVGKGFMTSYNETGRFGTMTDPQELRHKVIGDFDVTKTGAAYTWNLHLRNYPPNEVYNNSLLLVDGGVLQEYTDPIHTGVDLVNFLVDGPHPTPTDRTTDFEEVTFTRDPIKNITAGYLGVGAKMDVSRNTILFLEVNSGEGWVRIQGTTCNHIYINDTYAVTGDDGSMYGEQNELLLLYIHYQQLNLTENFYQYGYTFTPFGLNAPCTDCYTGKETFADAGIAIESAVGTSHQDSTDVVFGLYPHPKVESVVPDKGSPNSTMEVTISGKYFLRVDNTHPNSGSVDFGPGITVNSYTINNATNPIDNSIMANITIGDTSGVKDVNVTSCFGYSNGNGTAPYKSGHGVFTVVLGNSTLDGNVDLGGRPATDVTVRLFTPGTHSQAAKLYGTTDSDGNFTIEGLPSGIYDVGVKGQTSLSILVYNQTFNSTTTINFGTLVEGDASGDDYVDGSDLSPLSSAWYSYPGCPGGNWNPDVDFNRDNIIIDGSDLSLLSSSWYQWGPCMGWPGNWD
jgi:hypothetical protein